MLREAEEGAEVAVEICLVKKRAREWLVSMRDEWIGL